MLSCPDIKEQRGNPEVTTMPVLQNSQSILTSSNTATTNDHIADTSRTFNYFIPLQDGSGLDTQPGDSLAFVPPPLYMRQTFSGAQPAGANNFAEADRVRNSFRSGSLWSVKKLPKSMKSGEVTKERLKQTKTNLTTVKPVKHLAEPGPLSIRAEKYVGTSYDKVDTLHKLDVDEKKFQMEFFSRKPFSIPVGSSKVKSDGFIDPDFGPGGGINDEIILRKPKDADFIEGPFYKCVPAGASEAPRSEAKGYVKSLYEQLTRDWSHLMFSVKLTPDEIVIKFPATSQTLPPEDALQKYMKRQAAHGDPQSWGLRKRGDRWGTIEVPSGLQDANSISSVLNDQTQAREPMLTFSFFLPWVTVGVATVTKAARDAQRARVRNAKQRLIDEKRRIEADFLEEQRQSRMTKITEGRQQRGRSVRRSSVSNISLEELMKKRTGRK